jgi:hypothetical protein
MQRRNILEDTLRIDGVGQFPVQVWIDIPESGDRFTITFHIHDLDGEYGRTKTLAKFKIRFQAYNPIDAGFVTSYVSKYGICVTWKMSKFTIRKGMEDYETYKKAFPESSIRDAIKDVWAKFEHDGPLLKKELKKVLTSCLLPRMPRFGGDEEAGGGSFFDF